MFNFTTNVIINNADQFGLFDKDGAATTSASDAKMFRVKRYRDFKIGDASETVKSIYKAAGYEEKISTATIKAAALTGIIPSSGSGSVLCRLTTYVKLQGSNNPLYANDWVVKGKPFGFEFIAKSTDTATTLATKIYNSVKKIQSALVDDPVLTVTYDDSGNVTLTGVNEYQKIAKVEIQKYVEDATYADGTFETVYSTDTLTTIDPTTGNAREAIYFADGELTTSAPSISYISVDQGIEGFGTHKHLQKDYRLPTNANTRWLKIDEDNYPIKGKIYTQYTIKVETDRGITGQSVVGQPGSSITTHIFWVPSDLTSEFEEGLVAIGWVNGNSGDTNENGVIDEDETKALSY